MRRYREGEAGDPVFERLLGIEMKREQYVQGRAFCDFVVEQTNEATLTGCGTPSRRCPRCRRSKILDCGSPAAPDSYRSSLERDDLS